MECLMILEGQDWARVSLVDDSGDELQRQSGRLEEAPAMLESLLS